MAEDINSCHFSGNLTRDPELRMTTKGTAVLTFSVAVNGRRKSGEVWEDAPEFPRFVMYGNRAEALSACLRKGTKVFITSHHRESTYERDGRQVRSVEYIVDKLVMVGGKKKVEPAIELEATDIPF